jgi:Arc/MetJ-type ribon-helix-helix transcriptional regulator
MPMTRKITLMLNQQQLELLDRAVQQGAAADRGELIRLAIREQAAKAKVNAR